MLKKMDMHNTRKIGYFYVYKAHKNGKDPLASMKDGEKIIEKLTRFGMENEELQTLLNEWDAYDQKDEVLYAEKQIGPRFVSKIESMINGESIQKTYREWVEILKSETVLSKEGKNEITTSLDEHLQEIKEMDKMFKSLMGDYDPKELGVKLYLSEADRIAVEKSSKVR